jgi:hypothetical protein
MLAHDVTGYTPTSQRVQPEPVRLSDHVFVVSVPITDLSLNHRISPDTLLSALTMSARKKKALSNLHQAYDSIMGAFWDPYLTFMPLFTHSV